MRPLAPISPVPPSSSTPRPRKPRFLTQLLRGRVLFAALALAGFIATYFWYTRYRGTGWSQTFNLLLWYRRSVGEDLYRPSDAMLLHGNRKLAEVALTFDDGPHPKSRPMILDTLKRYGAHATFFDVGMNMEHHPDLLRRTLAEGHEVANHSYHHLHLSGLAAAERHREINDTDITYCAITNRHLRLLRPPGMRYDATVLSATRNLGYVVVGYTTAAKDADAADPAPAATIAGRTLSRIENGSILLLHDYPATAEALPSILQTLRARGYRCVTVSEMLDHLPQPVHAEAGKQLASTP